MGNLHVKYLLIGGGFASFFAAQAIRVKDAEGTILLVGQEASRPYGRASLSKAFLRREQPRSALFTSDPDWFVAHRVQLRTGRRAAHLDTGRSIVTLDNGEPISYDRLLLATGAAPRPLTIPGASLPNVFYLRTIDEAERLHTAIDKAKAEGRKHAAGRGRAAVIGGGPLGVEVAASLTRSGIAVDLIVGRPYPWAKFAGEATGKFVSLMLGRGGVAVHDGARAQHLEGDGRVQRVVLSDGRLIDSDFLVAAVGTAPNKDLLRGTPIVAEKAILADEQCRTSEANVYAAGDCAAVRDPLFGKHRPPEQFDTAAVTGAIAGANMAGGDERMSAVTSFTTEFLGLVARGWGESKHVDRHLLRGTPKVEAADFVEIGTSADGRVSQVLAVGHPGEDELLEMLVRRRVQIDGNQEAMKDPAVPLKDIIGWDNL